MGNYEAGLDRIEAAIAPKDAFRVLIVRDGETQEQVLAAYAIAHRLTLAELSGTTLFLSETDARL